VNDDIVTNYEIQQRRRFLSLLNAPGEMVAQARETLVNERLQRAGGGTLRRRRHGGGDRGGVTAFASQANMSAQQFINALGQNGRRPETVRDFISVGISWRNVVRARFAASSQVTDAEIDRALAEGGSADAPGVAAVDYATIPIVGGRGGDALPAPRRSGTAWTPATISTASGPKASSGRSCRPRKSRRTSPPRSAVSTPTRCPSTSPAGGHAAPRHDALRAQREIPEGARDEVRDQLFQQRIGAYASGFLEELRADAIIVYGDG
jgi:hypothetical protein